MGRIDLVGVRARPGKEVGLGLVPERAAGIMLRLKPGPVQAVEPERWL